MNILVCGGAGYIGSHTCVELLENNHDVFILDNFSTGSQESINHAEKISGRRVSTFKADVRNLHDLRKVFEVCKFDAVIHFAALKIGPDSFENPLDYFENNILGTINILKVMNESRINHLVFSSSAAVYGVPELCPIDESAPLSAISPYGYTKLVAERIIEQICQSNPSFKVAILRYFNPVGAHPSGMIGDDLTGICGNVMSNICRVAGGIIPHLSIYGSDYPTLDGTAVRDYLHVVDLAAAHVRAFEYISHSNRSLTVNLGSGRRHSVLELVRAFEDVSGRTIPLCFKARRHGDVAECFASPKLAEQLLGWRSKLDINQACEDAWRWSKRSLLI